MRALLWKDFRINAVVLGIGVALLLGPYLANAVLQLYDHWPVLPDATTWARALFATSYFSLSASQLTLALLGGHTIACERADRSAEFLAALPPSRALILTSKAALGLLTALVAWGVNAPIAWVLAPALSDAPLNVLELPSTWHVAAGSLLVFGAAWLGSSFLESPTFAATLGIVAPFLVLGALTTAALVGGWRFAEGTLLSWYCLVAWIVGLICFLSGTGYYLRRVEP